MPKLIDVGEIILYNFDKTYAEEQKYKSVRFCSYYVMPKYEMELSEYISNFEGMEKISKILQISSQLLAIFKYVHAAKRSYNDLKPENVMVNLDSDGEPVVYLIDFGLAAKL